MDENKTVSSLSKTTSLEEMAEFWDSHDATDFEDETREVKITFDINDRKQYVAIDPDLFKNLRQMASSRGLRTESLVNLWLQERFLKQNAG